MADANETHSVIEVCMGPECREFEATRLLRELKAVAYVAERGHCRGLCLHAPVVHIGERCIPEACMERIASASRP